MLKSFAKRFIEDMLKDVLANKLPGVQWKDIFNVIEDVLVYLEKGDEEDCTINQHMIRICYLFRKFPVKV